jgi:hypothetical protein
MVQAEACVSFESLHRIIEPRRANLRSRKIDEELGKVRPKLDGALKLGDCSFEILRLQSGFSRSSRLHCLHGRAAVSRPALSEWRNRNNRSQDKGEWFHGDERMRLDRSNTA